MYIYLVLLSTHSIDPCLWGESDHPTFGSPASLSVHLASSSITPAVTVWCVYVWMLQRGIVVMWFGVDFV